MSVSFRTFSAAELEDARLAYFRNYNFRTMNCGRESAEITPSSAQAGSRMRCARQRPCRGRGATSMTGICLRSWRVTQATR